MNFAGAIFDCAALGERDFRAITIWPSSFGDIDRTQFVIRDFGAGINQIIGQDVGGGFGPFSANIIGRVVDVPGQSGQWQGLGLGLTWRTPWSGQLTVGADNVVTRGKNPFAAPSGADDKGTVPYVRYEQDL